MRFSSAIDAYLTDQKAAGRISSDASETVYRLRLNRLAEDVQNRDPRYVGREDIKRWLARWAHPNTQSHSRSIAMAFFTWLEEEGLRNDNPVRGTRRPRKREPRVYRLTQTETLAMLRAAKGTRERRAIFLGFCAGLRNQELRGLQGRHFTRTGWIWVSPDIAKGGKDRSVPVIDELAPIVADIIENVAQDEYVLPAQRLNPRTKSLFDVRSKPCKSESLVKLVKAVGVRAGIAAPIKPHAMRHAYADIISRFAGVHRAQALLGHSRIATTEAYLSAPTLDELSTAVEGFGFGLDSPLPPTPSPLPLAATPQRRSQPVLAVNSSSADVPVQSGFSEVLRRLSASPVLRAAARRMAT